MVCPRTTLAPTPIHRATFSTASSTNCWATASSTRTGACGVSSGKPRSTLGRARCVVAARVGAGCIPAPHTGLAHLRLVTSTPTTPRSVRSKIASHMFSINSLRHYMTGACDRLATTPRRRLGATRRRRCAADSNHATDVSRRVHTSLGHAARQAVGVGRQAGGHPGLLLPLHARLRRGNRVRGATPPAVRWVTDVPRAHAAGMRRCCCPAPAYPCGPTVHTRARQVNVNSQLKQRVPFAESFDYCQLSAQARVYKPGWRRVRASHLTRAALAVGRPSPLPHRAPCARCCRVWRVDRW